MIMLGTLLGVLSNLVYFALQVTGAGSFPKPLSPAMEAEYLERFHSGDMAARDKLIEHNLRLVAHIIKKYYASTREQEDLISIGTIGLIKGVSTYNAEKKTKLATYAARCIENEILMHFRNQKKSAQDVYINDPIDTDKDGNALTLMDVICDDGCIIEDIDMKLKSERLYKYIESSLEPREKTIICMRYGLKKSGVHTQREVAKKLGISRSYV